MTDANPRVLIVDDDPVTLRLMKAALGREFDVSTTVSPKAALRTLEEDPPDILVTDLMMDEMSGEDLLRVVKEEHPGVVTLVLTGTAGKAEAISAFKLGAYDLLEKPCQADIVRQSLRRACRAIKAESLNRRLLQELSSAVTETQRREAQLRTVLDTASNGIISLDGSGAVLSFNRAAQTMFACAEADALGRPLRDFVEGDPRDADQDLTRRILLGSASRAGGRPLEGIGRRGDGSTFPLEMSVGETQDGADRRYSVIVRDITERRESEQEVRRLLTALEQAGDAILITDPQGTIQYVNAALVAATGFAASEVIGRNPRIFSSGRHDAGFYRELWDTISSGRTWTGSFFNRRKDGSIIEEQATISPVRDESGGIAGYVCVKHEVTQQRALEEQLRQAQKLEAIGQLAAGIAHEINTPTQFVGDNVRFLEEAFGDILGLLGVLEQLSAAVVQGGASAEQGEEARQAIGAADLAYLKSEIPTSIQQSLEGVRRVMEIVRAMKDFSHMGGSEMKNLDLNRAVLSTATVSRNEWKYVADLETDLDPELPAVPCLAGELNQVFLNMIVNASHAIADKAKGNPAQRGKITISTRRGDDCVEVRIADTGTGIPDEVRPRIFDPFFTTKEVGKGTGQGLAIAHNVIVKKHKGTIAVESAVGEGTTFIIRLPQNAPERVAVEVPA
ncbi:MAG: PAS domain S-box protein [Planctomycetes bacterium]|nr:PAS domain S-box protein [Planctomycetota bacterium]